MNAFCELLACPACAGALTPGWKCTACGAQFDAHDGILNLRLPADTSTESVREFYEQAPFPGYPPHDSWSAFRARAERSRFAQLLDGAIPCDARIVEIGCGTGQMALYLAHADRVVVAADLSRAALLLGHKAARRFGVEGVHFIETDLHRPGLKAASFDVVYSAGVLHHTANPPAAFAHVARLARPGGFVIVGVYNRFARLPLRLRRAIARITKFRVVPFDPVLRARRDEPARREAWIRDQYLHPEEHCYTLAAVMEWFAENDVEYLRSFPSAVLEDERGDLFARSVDDWTVESWIAQTAWMWTLGGEGGLFFAIGRRSSSEPPRSSRATKTKRTTGEVP